MRGESLAIHKFYAHQRPVSVKATFTEEVLTDRKTLFQSINLLQRRLLKFQSMRNCDEVIKSEVIESKSARICLNKVIVLSAIYTVKSQGNQAMKDH